MTVLRGCSYGCKPGERLDKALRPGFDAHFVRVSQAESFHTAVNPAHYDFSELVLKEERQVLPLALVYFS